MSQQLAVVSVLLAAGCLSAVLAWTARWPRPATLLCLLLLALSGAVAATGASEGDATRWAEALAVALAGLLAVAGGGPVAVLVFELVDRQRTPEQPGRVLQAGEVLRGGAWIGSLERLGIFATLVAGWPEGVAVVLGLKGLGRYQELRGDPATGTAERFIIGTFTSVLWAVACAGVVWT